MADAHITDWEIWRELHRIANRKPTRFRSDPEVISKGRPDRTARPMTAIDRHGRP